MKWKKATSEPFPDNPNEKLFRRKVGTIYQFLQTDDFQMEHLVYNGEEILYSDLEYLDESAQPSPGYSKEQMGEAYQQGAKDQVLYMAAGFAESTPKANAKSEGAGKVFEIMGVQLLTFPIIDRDTYLRSLTPAKDAGVLDMPPYVYEKSKVNGFKFYKYLNIRGGSGDKGNKFPGGGEYDYLVYYAMPEEVDNKPAGQCERSWCVDNNIPFGTGKTIAEAYTNYQTALTLYNKPT